MDPPRVEFFSFSQKLAENFIFELKNYLNSFKCFAVLEIVRRNGKTKTK